MKKIYIIGLVIILIGGVFMAFSLNGNRAKHKEEFRERQERLALYFVNNYELANGEEIKEIKILDFSKDFMTGYWNFSFLVNGKYYADIFNSRSCSWFDWNNNRNNFILGYALLYKKLCSRFGGKYLLYQKHTN